MPFSMAEKLRCDAADRTIHKLRDLCGRVLDEFSPAEGRNNFKNPSFRHTGHSIELSIRQRCMSNE